MRDAIETRVEPVRIGPAVVVLSEENILGLPHHVLTPAFYPQTAQGIGRLASLGLQAELRLFLSIRSYDTLLPAAYAEALKHASPLPGGFAAARARLLATPPSWFDLVSRIRAAAPALPLRIWRQEDYRKNAEAIMEVLCGRPLGPLPDSPRPCPDPLALGGGDRGGRGPARRPLLPGAAGAGAPPARPTSSASPGPSPTS